MSDNKGSLSSNSGVHSQNEILSQPDCWTACLAELPQIVSENAILKTFAAAREWLFVGCGSSYYIALAAAASWSAITGHRARALPASELLLFPDATLAGSTDAVAVVISRSGRTSEALRAAELLEKDKRIRTLGITCTAHQALEQIATRTLTLPAANEQSTVMTRSFTSMLLTLQYTASCFAQDKQFIIHLGTMASSAVPVLKSAHQKIRDFVGAHRFSDYIALGQGPYFGLACECGLKLSEMSISYAQSYHTLEFRHGPKSVVSPETLVIFLVSEAGYRAEVDVLEEIKSLGGTTLTVVNHADGRIRASSDLVIELGFNVPEVARLAAYVFAGQLLGLHTGIKKGLDPDNPRNLSRVVILDDKSSEKTHAAL